MTLHRTTRTLAAAALMVTVAPHAMAQGEHPDRGLVVAKSAAEGKYFASWRSLQDDAPGTAFTLMRDGQPYLTGITGATAVEVEGTPGSRWQVVTDRDRSLTVLPWAKPYLALHVTPPADGYTANDCSVGDVDGDGQYELIVKWSSGEADNSHDGNTPNVYLRCYKLDMAQPDNAPRQLWSIDLGPNIRAGAHYTQFMVYDFDGDGRAEMMCKTAPGSKDGTGRYVNLAATDRDILKADNSKDHRNRRGRIVGGQEYLTVFSGMDGRALHTVFYQPNRDTGIGGEAKGTFNWNPSSTGRGNHHDTAEYGNRGERYLACVAFLDGMETPPSAIFTRGYYTYAFAWAVTFDGKEIRTRWYHESRSKTQYSVTDADGHKHTYTAAPPTSGSGSATLYANGNHNLAVGDVDGDGRDEMIWGAAALDDDGRVLYATGFGHGDAVHLADLDPSRPGLEVFDVHEEHGPYSWDIHDARTGEILLKGGPGGQDNGRGLTALLKENPKSQSPSPSQSVPVRESPSSSSPSSVSVRESPSQSVKDLPPHPSLSLSPYSFWSAADGQPRSAATGEPVTIAGSRPSVNFRIFWDGDPYDELLDGTRLTKPGYTIAALPSMETASTQALASTTDTPPMPTDTMTRPPQRPDGAARRPQLGPQREGRRPGPWRSNPGSFTGMGTPASNNWTKNNPCLQCDLFGDWREEVLLRDANDPTILYVYMSQYPTTIRRTTLMQDHLYRMGIAWQNVGYNQPPYAAPPHPSPKGEGDSMPKNTK